MTRKLLALSVAAAALSIGVAQAQTTTINAGGSSLAFPVYSPQYLSYSTKVPSIAFSYEAVGSGNGQKGFFANDIAKFAPSSGQLTYGTISGSNVDIGASDAFLTASSFPGVNADGTYDYTDSNGVEGSSTTYGPYIQIPTFGTAITIAFNPPVYNTAKPGKTPVYKADFTKLTLTDAAICGIFSGQYTDWGSVPGVTLTAAEEPAPLYVAYRGDNSGTTFLLTNHFTDANGAGVCNSTNAPNFTALAATQTFTALFGGATLPSNFTAGTASNGVQSLITGKAGTVGYLSPDYTSIAPNSPNYSKAVLTASVTNSSNGTAYTPSSANTLTGLSNPAAESTNLTPPAGAAAKSPFNWVPNVPQTTKGYPIVGYTTEDLSQCYANAAIGTAINTLIGYTFTTTPYKTDITNGGFSALPATFVKAITADFLSNTSKLNLNIDNTTVCANYTGR